jgi:hypothetical protein
MKLLCYILIIYVSGLITYPCKDNCENVPGAKTEKVADQHNDNTEHKCHTCSPFCLCSCCQINLILALKPIIGIGETVPLILTSFYKEISIIEISSSIWRPPVI